MYKCNDCDKRFEEPEDKITSYEDYYGVDGGHSLLYLEICPYCGSEDIQEIRMEELEDEQCNVDWEDN